MPESGSAAMPILVELSECRAAEGTSSGQRHHASSVRASEAEAGQREMIQELETEKETRSALAARRSLAQSLLAQGTRPELRSLAEKKQLRQAGSVRAHLQSETA